MINAFNHLGYLNRKGKQEAVLKTLMTASECDEVGLGSSATRKGKRIGASKAQEILALFESYPDYQSRRFRHFEEIQFFVDGISKNRVSDIACSSLKSFLIDFTISQCEALSIHCPQDEVSYIPEELTPVNVLNYNWQHYGVIDEYVTAKKRTFEDCKNDPLFAQIPILSAKQLAQIKKLPTGEDENADNPL